MRKKILSVVGIAAVLACIAAIRFQTVTAQTPGERDADYLKRLFIEPGGTPEEELWQVLVLFGIDGKAARWNGSVGVDGARLHAVEGYRFELPDRVLPSGGWEVSVETARVLHGSPLGGHGASRIEPLILPKGLLLRGDGIATAQVSIETLEGSFTFRPGEIGFGKPVRLANGRVEVQRIPPATDLAGTELRQHDFPSLAAGPDGTAWAVWLSYHDRREELNLRRYRDGRWTRLIPVGRASEDLWRPQVATDSTGTPWLVWSESQGGNWEIYAMAFQETENAWGERIKLSNNLLPDIEPHLARSPEGHLFVVWQAQAGGHSEIQMSWFNGTRWSAPVRITEGPSNDWEPAIAAGPGGRAWIVWDRYGSNYDVMARSYSPSEGLGPVVRVAATNRFEAHASVAIDREGRPWFAWEVSGANWGKDLGQALGTDAPGTPLGATRHVEIAVFDGGAWKRAAPLDPSDTLAAGATEISRPTLFFDQGGSLWVSFKRRYSRAAYRPSVHWEYFLSRLEGDRWMEPVVLPDSWSRKSTRMSLAEVGGRLWAFWPDENRQYAFASRPRSNRVTAGSLPLPGAAPAPVLSPMELSDAAVRPGGHANEAADVAAIRNHRIRYNGRSLQIVRGDLHRHTELSQDSGGMDDGSLPEFYRYMIDAADMDFGASTDHQAGGTDYWNALTQKLADMYHFPQRFTTLYAYERNLGNPHGHRNMIYTHRNYRIVPFFQAPVDQFLLPDAPDGELLTFNSNSYGGGLANDTKLLYEEVRKGNGIAIPHTSGTSSMGTDWRDNDPEIDVAVEIYQGARQNYEHKGAPRGIADGEERQANGGFQEPGLVWNAWEKGYRLGVIASSDHYSTHISYAMVYTPAKTREAIFEAIRQRHTYGATDNIIDDFGMGEHLMGDQFAASGPQQIRAQIQGTGPIADIHLIRDGKFIYRQQPNTRSAQFTYLDREAGKGKHWYYIRVEQADGQLAWSSPIWVEYR